MRRSEFGLDVPRRACYSRGVSIFIETPIAGAFLIRPVVFPDNRGAFSVAWNREEFETRGLTGDFVQGNISTNHRAGTVRGLHSQHAPHKEAKLIRCVSGAVFDVVVDLRPDSPTYLQWHGMELSAENSHMLYIPHDCLHGFQTLRDQTELNYLVSDYFHPEAARGYRYDDPAFAIAWPLSVTEISEKDLAWPPYSADSA